ncbi:MAG: hypothetical protein AAF696_23560, partial [Bacteroidota bacterium]
MNTRTHEHRLRLLAMGKFLDLSKILSLLLFLLVSSPDLAYTQNTSIRLQAEDAALSGSARTTNIHPGYDGSGFVGWITTVGSGLSLSPNVSVA